MVGRWLSVAISLFIAMATAPSPLHAEEQMCFQETGKCISGRFLEYWAQNGGLAVFGFPITDARMEQNPDTGQSYSTQWFERNRFELHPENPHPYDVLLGRLGDDRLRQLGENWQAKGREDGPRFGCLWFEETGHNVCDLGLDANLNPIGFKAYWLTHGLKDPALDPFRQSLALFGLPISDVELETNPSGDTVLTQWFERARFEWHPDKPDEFKVLLGLLGNEVSSASPAPQATRVAILDNHTSYRTSSGFYVVGEVQNQTAGTVSLVKVVASFYNKSGGLVATDFTYALMDQLKPGQRAPFKIAILSPPPDIAHYDLQIEWRRGPLRSMSYVDAFQVSSHAVRGAGFADAKYIFGQVRNNSGGPAKFVEVIATLYDAQGKVVQVGYTYTSLDRLGPGEVSPFEILVMPWRDAARYELQVQGRRP